MAAARRSGGQAPQNDDSAIANRNAEIAGNLFGEFLEINFEEIGRIAGDVPDFIRVPQPLLSFLGNRYVLGSLDVGVRSFVRRQPMLSPFTRAFLESLSDTFFDKLRQLPATASEVQVRQAAAEGARKAAQKIKEERQKKERKLTFAEIVAKLTPEWRNYMIRWVAWMRHWDQGSYDTWEDLKGRIESPEQLMHVLALVAADDEWPLLPIPLPTGVDVPQLRTTRKRIQYLETAYKAKSPSVWHDALEALAQGKDPPQLQQIRGQVEKAADRMRVAENNAALRRRLMKRHNG